MQRYQTDGIHRLVTGVIARAVKDMQAGSGDATRWLSRSDEAEFLLSSLDVDRDEFMRKLSERKEGADETSMPIN